MSDKHVGTCPFCRAEMRPRVVEENIVRRDKCECTECGKTIYVCRTPGCRDYAKGGDLYDDELCPVHTAALTDHTGDIAKGAVVLALGTLIASKMDKND